MTQNFYRYPWSSEEMNNYFYRSTYPMTTTENSTNRVGGILLPFVGGLLIGGLFAPPKGGGNYYGGPQPYPYQQPIYYQPYPPYPYPVNNTYYPPTYINSVTPAGPMYQTTPQN